MRLHPLKLSVLVLSAVLLSVGLGSFIHYYNKGQMLDIEFASGTSVQLELKEPMHIDAVRKAIVRDKSLSTYAHNVKVVTRGGEVTLRGPVRTSEEKARVSELAQQVSGVSKVNDELLVKNRKKS